MRRFAAVVLLVLVFPPASGQQLGPEFRVNTYTTNSQDHAHVAASPGGNVVVVWQSTNQDGQNDGVFAQPYDTSIALGVELQVNTYTSNQQNLPDVASDSSGNFVVVWRDYQEGSSFGVFGQRFSSAGFRLGTEFRVNTYTTSNQGFAHVASASSGSFVVVWQGIGSGGEYGIFGQRYDSAGARSGLEFQVNTYTTGLQRPAAVASDSAGDFVVVWSSAGQDGDSYGVFGQRYDSGGALLGSEFRVNTYTTGSQTSSAVASAPGGGFLVVWSSTTPDDPSGGVFGQRYDGAGAPLGGEFRVNTYTTGSQLHPSVASDADGSFLVVWNGLSGAADDIVAQVLASTGAPIGSEFRVNSYTTGGQSYGVAASRAAGDFVVVWRSGNQDGASYGVFRRGVCMDPFVSVSISAMGPTAVCPNTTGGTLTAAEVGGGSGNRRVWQYRTMSGGIGFPITNQTGISYVINGADFPGPNTYFVVCVTVPPPDCGSFAASNEIMVTVDITPPVVTAPSAVSLTQTLCQ